MTSALDKSCNRDNFIFHGDLPARLTLFGRAKIALPINRDKLWWLASQDKLLAKVPGPVTGWTAPPTLSAHTRNRWLQPLEDSSTIDKRNE